MKFYQFKQNDVVNQLRVVNPSCSFFVNDRTVYYNGASNSTASIGSTINSVPSGFTSLYEMNVDRASDNLIYPQAVKGSSLDYFKTVSTASFWETAWGDTFSGSYPLSASITRNAYPTTDEDRRQIKALKNTLNRYKIYSNHFAYSSSLGDKSTQDIALVDVPSIFFGSGIKASTLNLDFYVTGTLTGRLKANAKGELVQTLPQDANSGSVAGVVIKEMGAILLTGSWDVTAASIDDYDSGGSDVQFQWYYYLSGIQGNKAYGSLPSSSFHLHFESTSEVNTKLMFCTAPRGELNQSENPTFYTKDSFKSIEFTGSAGSFIEPVRIIKNIASASYQDPTAPFEKTTYISKIGLYDEDKNLVAVASLARPVKKTESRDITFKLKLDI